VFAEALLALAVQIGPFWEQNRDLAALRPFWASEGETTDVLWPAFTAHRDWWRFLLFVHYQSYAQDGYQFEIMPVWWNGRREGKLEEEDRGYAGLFPLYGSHPHFLLLYDWHFCLWPVWMRYSMPRPSEKRMMTTNAVLWPFLHWRDDGSWGFWPFYVRNHQRESLHETALWPIVTWASYEKDRDAGGEGRSWMVWPLLARVDRERESQWMFVPPLFSWVETRSKPWAERGNSAPEMRLRCPWPIFEWESKASRSRISVWPLYEQVVWRTYKEGGDAGSITRFGWKLVELYDDETRVFPFWVSRKDNSYFRLWPFYESQTDRDGVTKTRVLSLFPIRWSPQVDRNWSKFWTFYESEGTSAGAVHSLFWGLVSW